MDLHDQLLEILEAIGYEQEAYERMLDHESRLSPDSLEAIHLQIEACSERTHALETRLIFELPQSPPLL